MVVSWADRSERACAESQKEEGRRGVSQGACVCVCSCWIHTHTAWVRSGELMSKSRELPLLPERASKQATQVTTTNATALLLSPPPLPYTPMVSEEALKTLSSKRDQSSIHTNTVEITVLSLCELDLANQRTEQVQSTNGAQKRI